MSFFNQNLCIEYDILPAGNNNKKSRFFSVLDAFQEQRFNRSNHDLSKKSSQVGRCDINTLFILGLHVNQHPRLIIDGPHTDLASLKLIGNVIRFARHEQDIVGLVGLVPHCSFFC